MEILASNIANAATPGFKARDLDFAAVLKPAVAATPLNTTHSRHLAVHTPDASPTLRYRQPVQPSLDGNTVELATEQVQFAENALRYRTTLSVLNGRFSTLSTAMRSD